jgi:hypothetical protein
MIDWIMGFVVRSGYLGAFADPKTCIARRATRVEGRDMKHPFTGSGDPGRSAEQAYMITAGVGGHSTGPPWSLSRRRRSLALPTVH